ncbi:MAG: phosphodiester glycosidase family protein [Cytophagales bacterium]|nr:phosphodiester glycosidase family protein [Armatimonadota bacterium]
MRVNWRGSGRGRGGDVGVAPAFCAAPRFRAALCLCPAVGLIPLSFGCSHTLPAAIEVAPGITFRRDQKAGVQLLDIDLTMAKMRPVVAARGVENRGGNFVGDAKTVREWAAQRGAIAGINGGFFGDTYDQIGRRKQIVQLAVMDGKVIAPGSVTLSSGGTERYTRSAIGFSKEGVPSMVWGTGTAKMGPRQRRDPTSPESSRPWPVAQALACGPRLFSSGKRHITDREERLKSPGRLPRAFVAYDQENGAPRHLILGRADAMEFSRVADYLAAYFPEAHGTTPREAMCLDGGPSAQVVYRDPDSRTLTDAEPTGVLVPTAILILPR